MNYVVNFGSIFSCLISCVVFPECYSAGWEGGPEEPTQTTGNPKLQPAGSDSGCAEADGLFTGEQYNATDAECQTTGNPVTPLTAWCVFMGNFSHFFVKSENDTCWNRMGPSPNCYLKVRRMKLSKKSLYAETLRVSFTETKGLGPAPKEQPYTKIPHHPNFILVSVQSGKYRSSGNRQTHPSDCQTENRDSSLLRTRLHCSIVQWWSALHHCIQPFFLSGEVRLECSCYAIKTLSMKLSTQFLRTESLGSVAIDFAESWQPCI